MVKKLILILILISGYGISAQNVDCRVINPDISGTYNGGCKSGLAHGKGIAQGIDRYEGQFMNGMPDGRGTYWWASGIYYKGEWKDGLREGKGKMVYKDSIVDGYWKGDKYAGKVIIPPYKINLSMSVTRATIVKSLGIIDGVKIRIMRAGSDNFNIEDFSLFYDSGEEYRNGSIYGIQNTMFPLNVKVKYRAWNYIMTAQFNVIFDFTINYPGSWDVVITN